MNDDVQARDPGPVEHACAPETTKYIRVPSGPLVRIQEVFHGHPLSFYMFRGRPCAIAADVGRALEYANEGKALPDVIRKHWAEEMIEGKDFDVLSGSHLREFKALLDVTDAASVSRVPNLMVLHESGIDLVCIKTEKPLGKKLRRFLADEVLPKLRRGEPILPRYADALSGKLEMLLARMASSETAVATLRAELAKVTADAEASTALLAKIYAPKPVKPAIGVGAARLHILDPLTIATQIKARVLKTTKPRDIKSIGKMLEDRVRLELDFPRARGNGWAAFPMTRLGEACIAMSRLLADTRAERAIAERAKAEQLDFEFPAKAVDTDESDPSGDTDPKVH